MKVTQKIALILSGWIFLNIAFSGSSFYVLTEEHHTQSKYPLAVLMLGDEMFHVELAQTEQEQMYGLMNRLMLPQRTGMLFIFKQMDYRSFWMKNTKIPLDIIYIDDEGIIVNIQKALPCVNDPCPSYPSYKKAKYVLEVAQGEVGRLNIQVGDQLVNMMEDK